MAKHSVIEYIQEHEFLLLNISTLLILILYPIYYISDHAWLVFHGLMSCVILSGIYAAGEYKRFVPMVIILWSISFLLNLAEFMSIQNITFILVYMSCTLLFFLVVTAKVISTIINHHKIDAHVILWGISWYLMLGMAGAFLFGIVELTLPWSFNIPANYIWNIPEYIYYSFTTMTTLWYGDIYPVSHTAQIWSILITVFGQIYLSVFMWVLIGKYIRKKNTKDKD